MLRPNDIDKLSTSLLLFFKPDLKFSPMRKQPDPRNLVAGVAVTVEEQRDLQTVAQTRGVSMSSLMRDMTMAEITAEAARLRKVVGP